MGTLTCTICGRSDLIKDEPNNEDRGWTCVAGDTGQRPICWDCAESVVLSVSVDL